MANVATKVAMNQFKPVQFEFGKIHMKGGHAAKAVPMTSKTVEGPNKKNVTFIKMAVSEAWLITATTGQTRYHASSFGRTSLLDVIREHIQRLCDGDGPAASSAVAAAPQERSNKPMGPPNRAARHMVRATSAPATTRTLWSEKLCHWICQSVAPRRTHNAQSFARSGSTSRIECKFGSILQTWSGQCATSTSRIY